MKISIILYCSMVHNSQLFLCQIDWKILCLSKAMIWTRLPQTWYEAPLWATAVWEPISVKNPVKCYTGRCR